MTKLSTYVRLCDKNQKESLVHTLFSENIPFSPYPTGIYALSENDRAALEALGFAFEDAKVADMRTLSQAERNAIRKRCRLNALARTKEGIEKLRAKYCTRK